MYALIRTLVVFFVLKLYFSSCSKLLEYAPGGMQELSGFAELPGTLLVPCEESYCVCSNRDE